ncbi:hypothetical protein [Undibacterium sp. Di24W]|uniref:hypothetical protein n=1 Tax=Undibacterium sp. Di24W TaxID=3413033 RepID=UPI003BF2C3C3
MDVFYLYLGMTPSYHTSIVCAVAWPPAPIVLTLILKTSSGEVVRNDGTMQGYIEEAGPFEEHTARMPLRRK